VEVEEITRRHIVGNIKEEIKKNVEPKLHVALYQAIPKKPALFELIVQKATEIGVTEIFPLITERTQKRRLSKFDRLVTIATEAAEQSGRTKVPVIRHPVNYDEVVPKLKHGFIAYEYEDEKFLSDYSDEIAKSDQINIIIGPEGGLSENEIALTEEADLKPFSLGKRILRMETAAIAALSLVLLEE